MYIELLKQLDKRKKEIWQNFLHSMGLCTEESVQETVLLWDDEHLVGAGSRDGNLLKLIAVSATHQGEDLASVILSELRKSAFSDGFNHLFLYTKPKNEKLFQGLFFYTVAKTEDALFMENRKNGIGDFLAGLGEEAPVGTVGSIVMNANPFTLGHRYLIETAAKKCHRLYVFVVSEEKSLFSARDRMEMVKLGCADLPNVKILPTGPYLVSSATFPTYFLKDRDAASKVQCSLDVAVFLRYFVPKFSITCRFVGTEPLSPMTEQYNRVLKSELSGNGITVFEIPRLETEGRAISASRVRALLDNGDFAELKAIVPATTFEYLKTKGYLR